MATQPARACSTVVAPTTAAKAAAPLFQPYRLPSGKELQHRIVYAPLTRCRAFDNIPQARWPPAAELGAGLQLQLHPLYMSLQQHCSWETPFQERR